MYRTNVLRHLRTKQNEQTEQMFSGDFNFHGFLEQWILRASGEKKQNFLNHELSDSGLLPPCAQKTALHLGFSVNQGWVKLTI